MFELNKGVVIIDYGMGNLFSIERVLRHLGLRPIVSSDQSVIISAERLILPGVGAFGDGMDNLRDRNLVHAVKEYCRLGKPLLGICLGMQLLMSESEEFGFHPGLNLIEGKVKRLIGAGPQDEFYKIPHVGWNRLYSPLNKENLWARTILDGIQIGDFVYFVHSYAILAQSCDVVLAETAYGNNRFCSVLRQGNIYGCQFHPEVSGKTGLEIIKNFIFSS